MSSEETTNGKLKSAIYEVIFGYESKAGKLFDLALICMIMASVLAVMIDSVSAYHVQYGDLLYTLEWFFTIAFTVEYALRIYSSPHPRGYIFSFYGMIDLLSILPTYIAFLFPQSVYLTVVRILRVLRIFRILKLFRYIGEANILFRALVQARRKIFVFLFSVLTLIVIFGTLMFIIEGPENGFTSIPTSMYWAIVTVTTVGYGDISPQTGLGQLVAAMTMICGYAIIAVPTGIVGVEIMNEFQRQGSGAATQRACLNCNLTTHENDAKFCKRCGTEL
ncbi:MAG: ion transporter [Gammaproteobacteria bacterium]|nr:ion transporter [Gammaproteobacteria bacterium]